MFYYDIKYPYLRYPFHETDGSVWFMYSVPVTELAKIYQSYYGKMPKSFFDCGAAIGELVHQATNLGMDARGIDIKKYPVEKFESEQKYVKYFQSGRIKITNILDCPPPITDLAYCNGTLTYMTGTTLPMALQKFKNVGMLVAIHNTSEDILNAQKMGEELLHAEPRLIRPINWWLYTLNKNGFDADFDKKYGAFWAIPRNNKTR